MFTFQPFCNCRRAHAISPLSLEHVRVSTKAFVMFWDVRVRYCLRMFAFQLNKTIDANVINTVLSLEHVRVSTALLFYSMLDLNVCKRSDFVVDVQLRKNTVRLMTKVAIRTCYLLPKAAISLEGSSGLYGVTLQALKNRYQA